MFRHLCCLGGAARKALNPLHALERKIDHMSEALDHLTAQVADMGAAVQTAVSKIHDLSDQIAAANHDDDSAAIETLVAQLKGEADALRSATGAPTAPATDDPAPAPAETDPAA